MAKWTEEHRKKFSETMKRKYGDKKKYKNKTKEIKPLIKKLKSKKFTMTIYYNQEGSMLLSVHTVRNYAEAMHILYSEYEMHGNYIHEVRIV